MDNIAKKLAVAFGFCMFSHVSLAIDASSLADICEAMENAIVDISLEYEWDFIPPRTKEDIAGTGNLIADGPTKYSLTTKRPFTEQVLFTEKAVFMNERGDVHEGMKKLSYNGSTVKHFRESIFPSRGAEPRKFLSGTVSQSARFREQCPISLTPLGFTVLRLSYSGDKVPLSKCLRCKEGALVRIDNSIRRINDCNSICVDLLQESTKQVCLRIYFSVDHNYTPVRYEYTNGPDLALTFDITSLEKVANGLWFPSSGQSKVADPGERINRFYTTAQIRVNQGVKDEVFDMVFPPGTKVNDEISGKQYTIKPTQEQVDQTLFDK